MIEAFDERIHEPGREVPSVLRQLRARIKRYVLLEGSACVLVVLGLAFWFSLGIDYWFEPVTGVRQALLLLVLAARGRGAAVWYVVLLQLARDFRTRALALVLERRFPELNDRLITAVELAESRHPPSGLTAAMLHRAADEAAELSHKLELREVFNVGPMARAIGLAILLLVSIAAIRPRPPARSSRIGFIAACSSPTSCTDAKPTCAWWCWPNRASAGWNSRMAFTNIPAEAT